MIRRKGAETAEENHGNMTESPVAAALARIEQVLPESTPAERERFLQGQSGNASAAVTKLDAYLRWRQEHCEDGGLARSKDGEDSWAYATRRALSSSGGAGPLPGVVFLHNHESTKHESNRFLMHIPARIVTQIADTSVYALALAIFIDDNFDRSKSDRMTLLIDTRSGDGFANPKAYNLLSFIQSTATLLQDLHPGRLEQCIVYPVPTIAGTLFNAIKPFLGKEASTRIHLVSGPSGRKDKVPKAMKSYLDDGLIDELEDHRQQLIKLSSS